jgi:hypothetical protein
LLCSFLGYSSKKTSKTLTIDACVKDLSDLINKIGERYLPPLPRAAGKNSRKTGLLHTKAYKSKNKINFRDVFGYSQRRGIHVHHVKKSTLYLYSKCTFFAAKSKGAILITPPRNGNLGNGYRDLLESSFKIGKNSPMPKKIAGEIFTKNKNNFLGTCLFSTFKAKNVIFCSRMCC